MNQPPRPRPDVEPSRSFDLVADAYDRGRPSYPDEAVSWLLRGLTEGHAAPRVLEVGAGTGKLTRQLVERGCTVTATDPSVPMLTRARAHVAHAHPAACTAEQLPVRARSVDLVVAAQSHHWFDAERFLSEAARVLRRGGKLAVLWNTRDERIPWVRRLGRIIGTRPQPDDPAVAIDESAMFESVERTSFRFWQPMTRASLRDLVSSRSSVAVMSDLERDRVLRAVDELYDDYGRGHDGMLLPYVTTVCRTTVLPWAVPTDAPRSSPQDPPQDPPQNPTSHSGGGSLPSGGTDDPGGAGDLLIDFR
jgi:SAM-dependent methyltransferase